MKPIKVMIVDDSAVVRQVLSAMLAEHPGIEVIGVAVDPLFALDKMQREWPDVLVLDVEMPRMDGITFLKKLMVERPTPVVICSTLTTAGAQTTLQALAEGAVGVIGKPGHGLKQFLHDTAEELVQAIQSAARANLSRLVPRAGSRPLADLALPVVHHTQRHATETLVAIGTSTGGTQALEAILTRLPPGCPGLLIVQHMPERFTAAFAERLNQLCRIEVLEARDGERVMAGRALIAPGGRHMLLTRSGAQYLVEVRDGPPVSRHRPSVDVLFRSVARAAGRNALGIIMTGMGDDGARGLKEMREAGARTLAQDEASCVVFGMPKEAIKLGAAERVLPLCDIPSAILASTNARGGV
ncbi:protein-glutamate methylesterase/protein-glutamine glutaminase [Pseudomonas frederiksbergensis]|jgi:two-component system chemotaxis response regulator CheB|uniref:protein-glutamate methylesterase/protein-glutamine glutaminase n=1 Tax=Pseudomonas frederiksbergensis TaxID=104087 RepID=UPI003D19E2E2